MRLQPDCMLGCMVIWSTNQDRFSDKLHTRGRNKNSFGNKATGARERPLKLSGLLNCNSLLN